MEFEFDKQKSDRNKEKHGIDFIRVQILWEDPGCVVIPAKTVGEARYLIIGNYAGKIWSAIFTIRDQRIRIISARRSRKDEEKIYKN